MISHRQLSCYRLNEGSSYLDQASFEETIIQRQRRLHICRFRELHICKAFWVPREPVAEDVHAVDAPTAGKVAMDLLWSRTVIHLEAKYEQVVRHGASPAVTCRNADEVSAGRTFPT